MIRLSGEFCWLPQRQVHPGFSSFYMRDEYNEYINLSVPENSAKFKPPLFWLWWMWT